MKIRLHSLLLALVVAPALFAANPSPFKFTDLPGLEASATVMRRDPSDIIKVGETYYVWYTKGPLFHGYDATIWYATSSDGHTWREHGESVGRGGSGAWDEQSVFTPSILVAEGKYWLFFTAVPKPFTNEGNRVTKSAIGLAVADSPDGPWRKLPDPILRCTEDPARFDSMRVDDACLIKRDGAYWMYYKGRAWDDTPAHTMMGVAIAKNPAGPYVRHPGNPVVRGGHEVLVWPRGRGVMAMINNGPEGIRRTLQFAADGVSFKAVAGLLDVPGAPGAYRPEAFTDSGKGAMIPWGISIITHPGMLPSLQRYDCDWSLVLGLEP